MDDKSASAAASTSEQWQSTARKHGWKKRSNFGDENDMESDDPDLQAAKAKSLKSQKLCLPRAKPAPKINNSQSVFSQLQQAEATGDDN